jgi:hypothetical protein
MNRSGVMSDECLTNAIDLAVPNVLVLGKSSRHRYIPERLLGYEGNPVQFELAKDFLVE